MSYSIPCCETVAERPVVPQLAGLTDQLAALRLQSYFAAIAAGKTSQRRIKEQLTVTAKRRLQASSAMLPNLRDFNSIILPPFAADDTFSTTSPLSTLDTAALREFFQNGNTVVLFGDESGKALRVLESLSNVKFPSETLAAGQELFGQCTTVSRSAMLSTFEASFSTAASRLSVSQSSSSKVLCMPPSLLAAFNRTQLTLAYSGYSLSGRTGWAVGITIDKGILFYIANNLGFAQTEPDTAVLPWLDTARRAAAYSTCGRRLGMIMQRRRLLHDLHCLLPHVADVFAHMQYVH